MQRNFAATESTAIPVLCVAGITWAAESDRKFAEVAAAAAMAAFAAAGFTAAAPRAPVTRRSSRADHLCRGFSRCPIASGRCSCCRRV